MLPYARPRRVVCTSGLHLAAALFALAGGCTRDSDRPPPSTPSTGPAGASAATARPAVSSSRPGRELQGKLARAVRAGKADLVRDLIRQGADPNAPDDQGNTLLHSMCGWGRLDMARLLLDLGADIHAEGEDRWRPIQAAAWWGRNDLIELFLARGADLHANAPAIYFQKNWGGTALHIAAWQGRTKTAEFLIDKGAALDARTQQGNTPLHCAASRGWTDTVKLLLAKGASKTAKNNAGETPYATAHRVGPKSLGAAEQAAAKRAHEELLSLLKPTP